MRKRSFWARVRDYVWTGRNRRWTALRKAQERKLTLEPLEDRRLLTATPISLVVAPNPAVYGQTVTAIAGLPAGATGTVSFYDGDTSLGSGSVGATTEPAMQFDGTSGYVNLGQNFKFTASTAFSVSFWIDSTNTAQQMIVGKGQGFVDHTSPGWTVFSAYGYLYFQLNGGTSFGVTELQARKISTLICTGGWQHVVVTYDGTDTASGVKMYVNDVEKSVGSDSDDLSWNDITNNDDATIGATPVGTGLLSGKLQEVAIFSGALSSTDVYSLYNSGAGDYGDSGVGGLLADYGGDIKDDSAAADLSGNGYNGMARGGVTATAGHVAATEASLTTSSLSVGLHVIEADYSGNDPSASATAIVNVINPSATTLTPPEDPVAQGSAVNLTATIDGEGAGTPTGVVKFLSDSVYVGAAVLDSTGVGTLNTTELPVGTHSITAEYEGDANFAGSSADQHGNRCPPRGRSRGDGEHQHAGRGPVGYAGGAAARRGHRQRAVHGRRNIIGDPVPLQPGPDLYAWP